MDIAAYIPIVIIAYCIGSISSAILVCKVMRLPDPRTQGSRNPGATNVLRIAGKKAAAITLLGDLLKGFFPVLAVKLLGLPSVIVAVTAFAAFLGHIFPIFFRFEGGKGVATLLGCLIVLSWPAAICWGLVWLTIALLFRYSSLASLIASILAPVFVWYFSGSWAYTISMIAMLPLLIARHHNNINALLKGNERKIGKKS